MNSAIECVVRYKALPIVGERTDRQRSIPFGHSGNTLDGKNAFEDREYLRQYLPLSATADVETAPGGADVLTITLTDGTSHEQRVDVPKGDPRDPLTEDEIAVKFTALGRDIVGKDRCRQLRKLIMSIEREATLDRLFELMTRS